MERKATKLNLLNAGAVMGSEPFELFPKKNGKPVDRPTKLKTNNFILAKQVADLFGFCVRKSTDPLGKWRYTVEQYDLKNSRKTFFPNINDVINEASSPSGVPVTPKDRLNVLQTYLELKPIVEKVPKKRGRPARKRLTQEDIFQSEMNEIISYLENLENEGL